MMDRINFLCIQSVRRHERSMPNHVTTYDKTNAGPMKSRGKSDLIVTRPTYSQSELQMGYSTYSKYLPIYPSILTSI